MSLSDIFSWIINTDIRVYIGAVLILIALGSFEWIQFIDKEEGFLGGVKTFITKTLAIFFVVGLGIGGAALIYFYW